MSLENSMVELGEAIKTLTALIQAGGMSHTVPAVAPAPAPQQTFAPPLTPAAAPAPVAATVPPMPPAPSFLAAPAAPAATVSVPFNDSASLSSYIATSYRAMAPAKGAQIQGILTQLGCSAINEVRPDQYPALFQAVEALKAS